MCSRLERVNHLDKTIHESHRYSMKRAAVPLMVRVGIESETTALAMVDQDEKPAAKYLGPVDIEPGLWS